MKFWVTVGRATLHGIALQIIQSIRARYHDDASTRKTLTDWVQDQVSTLLVPARDKVVDSVPNLTHGIFYSIRSGFVGDTVRKYNFKLLLQLQESLSPHLHARMEEEDLVVMCDVAQVRARGCISMQHLPAPHLQAGWS